MSMDGTDVAIMEPSLFNRRWFSYKLNGAGLRYEVLVSINRGHIVWIKELFRLGEFNDVQIFCEDLRNKLKKIERYGLMTVMETRKSVT